jgi:hypothetical protein
MSAYVELIFDNSDHRFPASKVREREMMYLHFLDWKKSSDIETYDWITKR